METLPRRRAMAVTALVSLVVLAACSTSPTTDPSTTAAGRTLSAQELADIDAALAQAAENFGLTDPPQVDIVRVVSAADYPSTQVECLHDHGYTSATLTSDGTGVAVKSSADQTGAYQQAVYTCMASYPVDPAQDDVGMTREEKLVAYHYLTERLVECLADRGYTTTGMPTEESFLASWDSNRWNPYEQVPRAAWTDELLRDCPPNTPPEILWGD